MKRIIILIAMLAMLCGCGDFYAGIPEGLAGTWSCQPFCSEGQGGYGDYILEVRDDGNFKLYETVHNKGVEGVMGNYDSDTVECDFEGFHFTPPYCWDLDNDRDSLHYEIKGNTLKLTHDGVWLMFERQ